MRFLIPDGREKFYQWDANQRLRCLDLAAGVEVHFSTPMTDGDALVTQCYEEDGAVWVDVPNELLCSGGVLTLYVYPQEGEEGHTAYEVSFPILSREKPADYIYTPAELQRWEVLEQRLAGLEENGVPSADAERALTAHNEDTAAHGDIRALLADKLDEATLDTAVEDALARAKASGVFDGADGAAGADGFSPTVTVEEIDGGHRVTVTDAEGSKTFDVMDGVDGAAGTGSVANLATPDWSQNDSTAADYIKNRPFYAEEGEVELLALEGVAFAWDADEGSFVSDFTASDEMLAAWDGDWEECTVIWDGVSYTCQAQIINGVVKCVGDCTIVGGTGNGEPFMIAILSAAINGSSENAGVMYSFAEDVPEDAENAPTYTHDASVVTIGEVVHPLDPKYIKSVPWKKVTDRPFGYWAPGELKLADNQSVTMEEYTYREGCVFARMKAIDFVEGASYTVTWCGTKYTCTAVSVNPYTYVGNPYWASGNTDIDTGEPFFIGYQWDFGQTLVWASADNVAAGETAEFTIANAEEYVKTIDEIYLPESGDSSGSGLPEVTTDDNDKVLQVVDGVWQTVTLADSTIATYIDSYINEALGGEY